MKNIIKKSSALAVVLMAVMLFAGISCYALDTETTAESAYSETEVQTVSDTDAVETQTIEVCEASDSEEKSLGKNLAIGIGSGLIIAFVVCICIKSSYKNHGKTEPYQYDENAKLNLIDSSDVLVNTHIEKRKINKDNNQ